jgi:cyclophilin family peptidyl-prolyl cis-trans isomerase
MLLGDRTRFHPAEGTRRVAGRAALAMGLALTALAVALAATGLSTQLPATAAPADAVVKTREGTFAIRLDAKDSPHTVASFEKLARKGFFDGTIFHRIVPGFVIQGGDPSGSGSGGPGYTTTDPPPADARYTKGVVAMAKTSQQPAGTAGSQFFVVTGADAGLPPEYALLGKVVSGMDVVEKIGELGDPQTERPTKRVVVESISIRGR